VDREEVARLTCSPTDGESRSLALLMPSGNPYQSAWTVRCESHSLDPSKNGQWERAVGAGYALHLLQNLAEARIPALPPDRAGVDGTTYELRLTRGFNQVSYTWWPGVPRNFEPLAAFCNELLKLGGLKDRVPLANDE
jgi:hypothetical protein